MKLSRLLKAKDQPRQLLHQRNILNKGSHYSKTLIQRIKTENWE